MGAWELSCEVNAASLNFGDKSRTKATVYGAVMMVGVFLRDVLAG